MRSALQGGRLRRAGGGLARAYVEVAEEAEVESDAGATKRAGRVVLESEERRKRRPRVVGPIRDDSDEEGIA